MEEVHISSAGLDRTDIETAVRRLAGEHPDILVTLEVGRVLLAASDRSARELDRIWSCALLNARLARTMAPSRAAVLLDLFN